LLKYTIEQEEEVQAEAACERNKETDQMEAEKADEVLVLLRMDRDYYIQIARDYTEGYKKR
jgi:uncharacterized protein (DUF4415 family)